MLRTNRFTTSPLFAGVVGGLVVAVAGAGALAAGWIGDDESATPAAALSSPSSEAPLSENGLSVHQIYEKAAPGVAHVEAELGTRTASAPVPIPGGGPFPEGGGTATGSGFAIDQDGHIITNAHVVENAQRIDVTLGDQPPVQAELVGSDPSTDIAVLKVDPDSVDLHPVSLADSSQVQVGDPVVAIGNPFGLDNTATAGIVSALQREIQAPNGFSISDAIQTDAPINPGNSGGPLFDSAGQVIGINSQIATGGGGNGSVGIGFAVPSSTAGDVARQLLDTGEVQHAFLGISGADVSPALADALNLSVDQGALVNEVTKGGPADEAGVQAGTERVTVEGQPVLAGGDVITKVDGQPVTGMDDVVSVVNSKQAGDEITLAVLRDGHEMDIHVTLGDRPAQAA